MSKRKSSVVRLTPPQFGWQMQPKPTEAERAKPEPTATEQPSPESVRIEQLKKLAQQMREEFERNPPAESKGKYDIRVRRAS